ncbi:hypothetical protein B0J14DRAFT_643357 [Halenospora varia]|nr:hypothetical protein B0J14DRAFT_643357 [Halenospora varia]
MATTNDTTPTFSPAGSDKENIPKDSNSPSMLRRPRDEVKSSLTSLNTKAIKMVKVNNNKGENDAAQKTKVGAPQDDAPKKPTGKPNIKRRPGMGNALSRSLGLLQPGEKPIKRSFRSLFPKSVPRTDKTSTPSSSQNFGTKRPSINSNTSTPQSARLQPAKNTTTNTCGPSAPTLSRPLTSEKRKRDLSDIDSKNQSAIKKRTTLTDNNIIKNKTLSPAAKRAVQKPFAKKPAAKKPVTKKPTGTGYVGTANGPSPATRMPEAPRPLNGMEKLYANRGGPIRSAKGGWINAMAREREVALEVEYGHNIPEDNRTERHQATPVLKPVRPRYEIPPQPATSSRSNNVPQKSSPLRNNTLLREDNSSILSLVAPKQNGMTTSVYVGTANIDKRKRKVELVDDSKDEDSYKPVVTKKQKKTPSPPGTSIEDGKREVTEANLEITEHRPKRRLMTRKGAVVRDKSRQS